MIAKRISIKRLNKSHFASLVRYITSNQAKAERVSLVTTNNCYSDDPQWAAIEVQATQALNTRAVSDKTYHLMISFRTGEKPPVEVLKAIEARLCVGLGFEEHQRISAVHTDTDNLHIHVAINKIHPTRHTLHEPYYDHKKLGKLCEQLEHEFGLERDNHTARMNAAPSRAQDIEHVAGVESVLSWIRRTCLPSIETAHSWDQMHDVLHKHGLKIRERGNGLVIVDQSGTGVKASSVSRHCSKSALEARLGKFQPATFPMSYHPNQLLYQRQPVYLGMNTADLYALYQADQRLNADQKTAALKGAQKRKEQSIARVKRIGRMKRTMIKFSRGKLTKRILYGRVRHTLQSDIQKINRNYADARRRINHTFRRVAWIDWLKAKALQGDVTALNALRARRARANRKGDTVTACRHPGRVDASSIGDVRVDSITTEGTVIYRVADTIIRDDGAVLKVAEGATRQGIEAVIRLAVNRYGNVLSVSGSDEFKWLVAEVAAVSHSNIVFDDPALERDRRTFVSSVALAGESKSQGRSGGQ